MKNVNWYESFRKIGRSTFINFEIFEEVNKQMHFECFKFFMELAESLKDTHEIVGPCNKDNSLYLVPKGTADQISYYGKPQDSYRVSDHWNWYSSQKKCSDLHYIQCYSVDMPWAKKRLADGKASSPIFGWQVAKFGEDGKYHHIFGERFDRKTKTWTWDTGKENSDEDTQKRAS